MSAPLILGTNSIKDTGYDVDNSIRYNDGDSPQLTRVNSSDGNLKNWTFSVWVKRSSGGATKRLLHCRNSGGSQFASIFFNSSDQLEYSSSDGSNSDNLVTNRVFRDFSSWYNIVVVWDSDNSTSSDRIRFFVNGSRETSFATSDFPALNQESMMSKGTAASTIGLGFQSVANSEHFDGYMCEAVFLDGTTSTDASEFGEFDEDSPTIWKPIDVSGLTFGSHGYYLDFEDSSALGDDVSGNNNDFTPSNFASTDQSTDTCTNNFATLNPLNVPTSNAPTFSEGNLISSTSDSAKFGGTSTIGVSSGKWYAEFKSAETGGEEKEMVGVTHSPAEDARNGNNVGRSAGSFAIRFLDGQQSNNNSASAYGSAFSVGDICQVALDVDNNQLYFGKNGQWGDGSGNFNQSTPTSAITITTIANSTEGAYFFAVGDLSSSSGRSLISCNFGSPPFSISSGNADANGHGNFEYSVPSGYFALCSKNLAEYG
jgi:hypothetical protein